MVEDPSSQPPDMESDQLITLVNKATTAIVTRLQSKYTKLVIEDAQISDIYWHNSQ